MHYTDKNFKTKKQLKEAVATRLAYLEKQKMAVAAGPITAATFGQTERFVPPVTVYNPETFSGEAPTPKDGTVAVGGPHYPAPHVWYSTVTLKNGEVIKVK